VKIDLHTHTTYSDGTLEPEELIQSAHDLGITHIAVSDHDSTASLDPARARAKDLGVTIIPGVEINSRDTSSIHVLGYFIDEHDPGLQKMLGHHRELRSKRAQKNEQQLLFGIIQGGHFEDLRAESVERTVEIDFPVVGFDKKLTCFTTRVDTIFGATYMVLAPEHSLIKKICFRFNVGTF